jgi:hypothetical protein
MSNRDYAEYLEHAVRATTPDEISRIRQRIVARWPGDPRAEGLVETLFEQESLMRDSEGSIGMRMGMVGEPTRAEPRIRR